MPPVLQQVQDPLDTQASFDRRTGDSLEETRHGPVNRAFFHSLTLRPWPEGSVGIDRTESEAADPSSPTPETRRSMGTEALRLAGVLAGHTASQVVATGLSTLAREGLNIGITMGLRNRPGLSAGLTLSMTLMNLLAQLQREKRVLRAPDEAARGFHSLTPAQWRAASPQQQESLRQEQQASSRRVTKLHLLSNLITTSIAMVGAVRPGGRIGAMVAPMPSALLGHVQDAVMSRVLGALSQGSNAIRASGGLLSSVGSGLGQWARTIAAVAGVRAGVNVVGETIDDMQLTHHDAAEAGSEQVLGLDVRGLDPARRDYGRLLDHAMVRVFANDVVSGSMNAVGLATGQLPARFADVASFVGNFGVGYLIHLTYPLVGNNFAAAGLVREGGAGVQRSSAPSADSASRQYPVPCKPGKPDVVVLPARGLIRSRRAPRAARPVILQIPSPPTRPPRRALPRCPAIKPSKSASPWQASMTWSSARCSTDSSSTTPWARPNAWASHLLHGPCSACCGPRVRSWRRALRCAPCAPPSASWRWAAGWPWPAWWATAAVPMSRPAIAIRLLPASCWRTCASTPWHR